MKTVAILSDKLILVTGVRPEQARAARAALKADGYEDVHLLWFSEDFSLLDLREAPPEVTEAAKLVDGWLNR